MSRQSNGVDITLIAAADLSAKQYRFVKVDANGQAALASAAGEVCVGVLQNKPTSGQAATVRIFGVSKVVANAAVSAGALIKTSSDGEADTASKLTTNTSDAGAGADAGIGSDVLGIALVAAANAGEIIPVLLQQRGGVATTAA